MLPLISNPAKTKAKIGASAKAWVLFAFSFIASGSFSWFLKGLVGHNGQISFIATFVSGLLFLAIFCLMVILVRDYGPMLLFLFLDSVAMIAVFYDRLSVPLIVGSVVLLACLVWGNFLGHREIEALLKVRFSRIAKELLPKAIFGLAVFSSIVYFIKIDVAIKEGGQYFISPAIFEKFLAPAAPAVKKFLPEFDLSLSVSDLAEKIAEDQVQKNPQTKILPASMQNQIIKQVASDFNKQFASFLGGSYDKTAKISVVFYQFIMNEVATLSVNMKGFLAAAIALLVFLTVIGFSFVFRIVSSAIAWIIYEIFIFTGFARMTVESRSQEMVVLD